VLGGIFKEGGGVGGAFLACLQNDIVAGAFAFGAEAARGVPHERVEPIDAASDLSKEYGEAVPAFDVGEFVKEDDAAFVEGPVVSVRGEEDGRAKDAEGHGDGALRAFEEGDCRSDA
jgi:hypothetical protein